MTHRWIRMLGLFQIVGAIMMFGFSVSPKLSGGQVHFNIPLVTWVFASIAFLAGVLLVGGHRSGVTLSFAVQLAQVLSFNAGWRYAFLTGPKLTWVIANLGTALYVGGGGILALTNAPTDGTLNGVGLGADINLAIMDKPLAEATWAVGINLVAVYFVGRLWRLRGEFAAAPATTAVIAPGAV